MPLSGAECSWSSTPPHFAELKPVFIGIRILSEYFSSYGRSIPDARESDARSPAANPFTNRVWLPLTGSFEKLSGQTTVTRYRLASQAVENRNVIRSKPLRRHCHRLRHGRPFRGKSSGSGKEVSGAGPGTAFQDGRIHPHFFPAWRIYLGCRPPLCWANGPRQSDAKGI